MIKAVFCENDLLAVHVKHKMEHKWHYFAQKFHKARSTLSKDKQDINAFKKGNLSVKVTKVTDSIKINQKWSKKREKVTSVKGLQQDCLTPMNNNAII